MKLIRARIHRGQGLSIVDMMWNEKYNKGAAFIQYAGGSLLLKVFLVFGLLLFTLGCAQRVSRVEHAGVYPQSLAEKTVRILPAGEPVSLDQCIDTALANNLDLQTLEIHKRLASLDRKAAFGNFLPNIELQFSFSATDKPQLRESMGGAIQLSDQELANVAIQLRQAVFLPQAWYLYDIRQKGEDISNLVLQRTRQLITLQVTTLYFACLTLEDAEGYFKAAAASTEVLLKETRAFEREGLVLSSQRRNVETLLAGNLFSLNNISRILTQTKADLLETLGLSPFGDLQLKRETPFEPLPQRDIADDVFEALLNRLELHIDDRTLEIRKQGIRTAIAAFLPQIVGIGSFSHSSDSFLKYSNVWSYGISAVLSVFNGFQNVLEYRAARERETEAFLKREQTCMMIMLEVLKSRHRLEQADEQLKVAAVNLAAIEERHREVQAQWKEGLLQLSELMDSVTKKDQAAFMMTMAKFQQQVALATLNDVLGRTMKEP